MSHCPLCHAVLCVTLSSVSRCPLCHTVLCVTLSSVSHCSLCHNVLCLTLSSVSHCPLCHTVLCVTLSSVSHCSLCHTVLCVTMSSVSHCSLCHTVLCVTMSSASHCPLCHTICVLFYVHVQMFFPNYVVTLSFIATFLSWFMAAWTTVIFTCPVPVMLLSDCISHTDHLRVPVVLCPVPLPLCPHAVLSGPGHKCSCLIKTKVKYYASTNVH